MAPRSGAVPSLEQGGGEREEDVGIARMTPSGLLEDRERLLATPDLLERHRVNVGVPWTLRRQPGGFAERRHRVVVALPADQPKAAGVM